MKNLNSHSKNKMSQPSLRSISTNSLLELQEWCRQYVKFNKYPTDVATRFSISFYQVYQGLHWEDGKNNNYNKNESFAAACLHLIMVSEMLELGLETILPLKITGIFGKYNAERLLFHYSRAQQHVFYGRNVNNTARSKRYNPTLLKMDIAECVNILFGSINKEYREQAIEDASSIMTGKL